MLRPAMSQISSKDHSYYAVVIAVAKRAREIADNLCENGLPLEEKPVKTAVDEFAKGLYTIIEPLSGRGE